jgi:hypothetical protein
MNEARLAGGGEPGRGAITRRETMYFSAEKP